MALIISDFITITVVVYPVFKLEGGKLLVAWLGRLSRGESYTNESVGLRHC
jgi:hypothetical protein